MARLTARKHFGLALISAAVAWSTLALPAAAQTDSAAARALFSEGRELVAAERYAEACPKFEESLRLDPGMGTQFNLAHCWEKLGRTASAWALFLDVAAAARAGNQPQREAAAKERASALESKLTHLRIVFPDATADAKVFRDDQEVGRAAWGTPMPVDPGEHVIHVTAKGKQDWSQDVKVPQTPRTFSVNVPALEDLPVAKETANPKDGAPAVEASPRDHGGSSGTNVAALVVGGVGLAALATGTIFEIQSRGNNSDALALCRSPATDNSGKLVCLTTPERERHATLVKDATRQQNIAYVGFGVGGAALATAIILYLSGGSSETSSSAQLDFAPTWINGDWGATLSGRF